MSNALAYGDISQGRTREAHPATAWRWVKAAVKRAEELGADCDRGSGSAPIRCATATPVHLLMNGIPINYLVCCQRASDVSVWTFQGRGAQS